jgi:hypothetical protein
MIEEKRRPRFSRNEFTAEGKIRSCAKWNCFPGDPKLLFLWSMRMSKYITCAVMKLFWVCGKLRNATISNSIWLDGRMGWWYGCTHSKPPICQQKKTALKETVQFCSTNLARFCGRQSLDSNCVLSYQSFCKSWAHPCVICDPWRTKEPRGNARLCSCRIESLKAPRRSYTGMLVPGSLKRTQHVISQCDQPRKKARYPNW